MNSRPYKAKDDVFSCKTAAHVRDADSHKCIFYLNCKMDYDLDNDSAPGLLPIAQNIYGDVEQLLGQ